MDWNEERILVARRVLAERLTAEVGEWEVQDELVVGPGNLAVRVEDHHNMGQKHFDFGFAVNRNSAEAPVVWDCAAGFGSAGQEVVEAAVHSWMSCDFPVFAELLTGKGEHAEHYHGDDPEGCPGWHVIHGALLGIGNSAQATALQNWVLSNPVLPKIGRSIASRLDGRHPHGVKLFFGSSEGCDTAEVRVDGVVDESSSEILQTLAWPRSQNPVYLRCFMLFVHEE